MKTVWVCLLVAVALPAWSQTSPVAQMQELAWPQSFDVQGLQAQSFGFAVTQPGLLVVNVQAQGAALVVAVRGPLPGSLPQPAPQVGPGGLRFTYNLTRQDVQRGIFWQVEVRLAPTSSGQPGARAVGTIALQRPPVNQPLVQQAVQAAMAQFQPRTPQQLGQAAAQMKAQMDAAFNTRKAQFAQHLAQRTGGVMAQLQPTVEAMRREKAAQPLQAPQTPAAPAAGADQFKSRGLDQPLRRSALPLPAPVINTMAIANNQDTIPLAPGSYGQPGDEVTLTGTNFGAADGELHFIIGPLPSQDMIVPPNNQVWLNTRIMAPVPLVSGVFPYAGALYVKRLSDGAKSIPVPFQFQPNVEQREIRVLRDMVLQQIAHVVVLQAGPTDIYRWNGNFFSGSTGFDRLFITTRLKNGWKTTQAPVPFTPSVDSSTGGSAWVQPSAVGTDVLALTVGFTVAPKISGNNSFDYGIVIPIQGPAGIPDGVVCADAQAPACPQTDAQP